MPNPTAGDVHVNGPLTNISIAYTQNSSENMVADKVFPIVPVMKQSDLFWQYSREDWSRIEAELRAPGTESKGGGWRLSTSQYYAHVYAFHKDIDDQIRANADNGINLDRDATEYVTQQLLLKREKLFAAGFFTTGVWSGDQTGVAAAPGANQFLQWNDAASTPIESIRAQSLKIWRLTGRKPNRLVLGPEVLISLLDHPDLIDRIKYTQRGIVNVDLLATLFDVERVVVGGAVENTAPELATGSYSFINGKAALLVYAAPSPSLLQPSGGYIFAWTGYLGAGAAGQRIKRFRMEPIASERVEGEMAMSMHLIGADLGVFFASAVA